MSKQCIVVGTRYCSFLHSDKLLLPLAEFSPLEISHTESHPENWQNILKCGRGESVEPKLRGNRIGDNLRRFDVLLHPDDFIS